MKIKYLLVLVTFLLYSAVVSAQLPMQHSNKSIFSTGNNFSVNSTFSNSQNSGKIFDIFDESRTRIFNNSLPLKLAANCSDSDSLLAPQAIPCNGVSVTSISFSNAIRTRFSGTDNTVGVKYKYANAGTAPDNIKVDAYVTVLAYSNNQDTDQTTFAGADTPQTTAF